MTTNSILNQNMSHQKHLMDSKHIIQESFTTSIIFVLLEEFQSELFASYNKHVMWDQEYNNKEMKHMLFLNAFVATSRVRLDKSMFLSVTKIKEIIDKKWQVTRETNSRFCNY